VHLTYRPDEIKAHNRFIKKGKGPALDEAILNDPKRAAVLRFPTVSANFIDIGLAKRGDDLANICFFII